jgi:hypothetical protein
VIGGELPKTLKIESMNTKTNGILLGSTMLLATVAGSWAGASPDIMNSITAARLEATKASEAKAVKPHATHGCAQCSIWSHTRNITAGQSTVAVPDFTRHCKE